MKAHEERAQQLGVLFCSLIVKVGGAGDKGIPCTKDRGHYISWDNTGTGTGGAGRGRGSRCLLKGQRHIQRLDKHFFILLFFCISLRQNRLFFSECFWGLCTIYLSYVLMGFFLGREGVFPSSQAKLQKEHRRNKTLLNKPRVPLLALLSPSNLSPLMIEPNVFLVSGSSPKETVPLTEAKGSLDKLRSQTQTPYLEATQWKEEIQESHLVAIFPLNLTYMARWCHNKNYLFHNYRFLAIFLPLIPNLAQWATWWDRYGPSNIHKFITTQHNTIPGNTPKQILSKFQINWQLFKSHLVSHESHAFLMGKAWQLNKNTQCFTDEKLAWVCTPKDLPGPEGPQIPQCPFLFHSTQKSKIGS